MKTALITGANKGIGFEVARQLGRRGFHVLLGARNSEAGLQAVKTLKQEGAQATFVHCDVTSFDNLRSAVHEISWIIRQIDVLVNNAAILDDSDNSVLELTAERLQHTLATNTFGPLQTSQAFVPLLRKSEAPRIINVSSGGGQLSDGMDGWAPAYCISKTALNAVTCLLSAALPDFAVNSVCPGWVRTDMGGSSAPRSVEEGADTIVWLAAEAPQELTGQFLRDRKQIPW